MALQEITAALGGLKAATEVGKAILAAGNAIEVAALRLQLADMMGSLAEARIALADAQDTANGLQGEIERLNGALDVKRRIEKVGDAFYEVGEDGQPFGEAYCMRCWEVDHRQRHLAYPRFNNEPSQCPACKSQYSLQRTRRIERA